MRSWFSWVRPRTTTAVVQPSHDGPRCPHCQSTHYTERPLLEGQVVNPNGEYVEGYGHALVIKQKSVGVYYSCASCGWDSRGSDVVITREQMDAV